MIDHGDSLNVDRGDSLNGITLSAGSFVYDCGASANGSNGFVVCTDDSCIHAGKPQPLIDVVIRKLKTPTERQT